MVHAREIRKEVYNKVYVLTSKSEDKDRND